MQEESTRVFSESPCPHPFRARIGMHLVEQHVISRPDPRFAAIDAAAFAVKNLYNAANDLVRHAFIFEHHTHVKSQKTLPPRCECASVSCGSRPRRACPRSPAPPPARP